MIWERTRTVGMECERAQSSIPSQRRLPDAGAARGVAHDEAADVDGVRSLEVLLDDAVDPSDEVIAEERGEDNVSRGAGEGLDARAKVGG